MLINRFVHRVGLLVASIIIGASVSAQDPSVSVELRPLVPHRVFSLIHAPEVHKELGLNDADVEQLKNNSKSGMAIGFAVAIYRRRKASRSLID